MDQKTILTDAQIKRVMAIQPVYGDDTDYAHYLRMGRAVEAATNAQEMAAALDCIVRRLQMDVDDGSRPDQWSMEDLIRTAKAALPAGWVIGAA